MTEPDATRSERRDFLTKLGLGGVAATVLASLGATLRYLFPAVFYEPSQRAKIGTPDDFAEGTVNFLPKAKVFVYHDAEGFHAVSSVCTHLGCIVQKTDKGFACPCHGSKFDPQGKVVGGPAPRALPWYELSLAPDGKLVVDRSRPVKPGTKLSA